MMTVEEMNQRKKTLGYSYQRIAELSALPISTVQKVLGGISKSPREATLQKLESVLKAPSPRYDYRYDLEQAVRRITLNAAEPVTQYFTGIQKEKKQGDYTVEDFYALPEGIRMELIEGVFYDMSMEAPTLAHQAMVSFLHGELASFVRKNKGKCMVLPGPVDVQAKKDEKNMVEPDVLVLCDRSKIFGKKIFGAPDLIIEVLSPSTAKKDRQEKSKLYEEAGVREYWMVDLQHEKVLVTNLSELEENPFPIQLYTFDAEVPVGIFNGECKIHFAEIRDELRELAEDAARNEALIKS